MRISVFLGSSILCRIGVAEPSYSAGGLRDSLAREMTSVICEERVVECLGTTHTRCSVSIYTASMRCDEELVAATDEDDFDALLSVGKRYATCALDEFLALSAIEPKKWEACEPQMRPPQRSSRKPQIKQYNR